MATRMRTGLESTIAPFDDGLIGGFDEFDLAATDSPQREGKVFKNTGDSLKKRFNEDADSAKKAWKEGNEGRAILRYAGIAGGTFGDVLGAPLDAVFEVSGINAGLEYLMKKGLDTETGKKILKVIEDNPEYAKDVAAVLDVASTLPAGKVLKNFVNDAFHNLETKVEGGTIGDLLHQRKVQEAEIAGLPVPAKDNFYNSFSPALVAAAMPDAIRDAAKTRFSPTQVATTRASGMPAGKRQEIAKVLEEGEKKVEELRKQLPTGNSKEDKKNRASLNAKIIKARTKAESDAMAVAVAANQLQRQRYGETSGMFAKGSPMDKYQYLATDIPVSDTEQLSKYLRGGELGSGDIPEVVVQRHLEDFRQAVASKDKNSVVDIINPNVRDISKEYASKPYGRGGSMVYQLFTEGNDEGIGGVANLPGAPDAYEYAKAAKTVDILSGKPSVWGSRPEGLFPYPAKIFGPRGTGELSLVPERLGGEGIGFRRAEITSKPKGVAEVLQAVRKAESGDQLTANEAKLVAAYNRTNVRRPDEAYPNLQHVGTSHTSRLKEYGGVHDMFTIKDGDTMLSSLSDDSDLFGQSFLGAKKSLSAITPIASRTLGDSGEGTALRNRRYLTKDDVNAYISTEQIENLSGVPKKEGEQAIAYQLRAIAEMEKKPELRDYAEVLKNVLLTSITFSGNNQFGEEE